MRGIFTVKREQELILELPLYDISLHGLSFNASEKQAAAIRDCRQVVVNKIGEDRLTPSLVGEVTHVLLILDDSSGKLRKTYRVGVYFRRPISEIHQNLILSRSKV
jgi:hypothetical protein